jgi:phenylpropionate dioxygenase-like ring-hydroxylating dioxygenase large terminal subunit
MSLIDGGQKIERLHVRPDFVPADGYISREFVQLEKTKLWPRVWLIAAREEQLKAAGDFVTFAIADESIVIVRDKSGELRAFYNVCQHRGRRLVQAESGNLGTHFVCGFHAWRYDLSGKPTYIRNKEDWEGCSNFSESSLSLKPVKLDTWAGWVWVSMNPEIEPLLEYLAPVPGLYRNFEFEKTRIGWYKTVVAPCNWKTVIDAFNEAYHTEGTHPQMIKFGVAQKVPAIAFGRHTSLRVSRNDTSTEGSILKQSKRDLRKHLHAIGEELFITLHALYTEHFVRAAERLSRELPEEKPAAEVMQTFKRFHREEMEKTGAHWPDKLTDAEVAEAGGTWHIFPNTIVLAAYDGALWYRLRPNGDDPDSCFFDIWWLGRYAPGAEPAVRHDVYANPAEFSGQNAFLEQDFGNLEQVQKGMKSRGFAGSRTNPLQETGVSHLHEVLYDYLFDDGRRWEAAKKQE